MSRRGRRESETWDGAKRPQYLLLSFSDRVIMGESDPDTSAEEAVLYSKSDILYLRPKNSGTIETLVTDANTVSMSNKTLVSPAISGPTITGGGSLAGTFSGAPTISGTWTFEANQTFRAGASSLQLSIQAFSTTTNTHRGILAFNRSASNSLGTNVATGDLDWLGSIDVYGVNSGNSFAVAGRIEFVQRGAAGSVSEPIDIRFATAQAEASLTTVARFTAERNLVIGSSALAPTSLVGGIVIANGTAPSASAANSVAMWAEDIASSSELRVRDEAGNVTTLSPHNFSLFTPDAVDPFPWSYYSENAFIGKRINVNMAKLVRLVEVLTGEKLMYFEDIPAVSWDAHQVKLKQDALDRISEWEARGDSDTERPEVYVEKPAPAWLVGRLKPLVL